MKDLKVLRIFVLLLIAVVSYNTVSSRVSTVKEFDVALGATKIFPYVTSKGNTRIGAEFPKGIKHKLVLKTL